MKKVDRLLRDCMYNKQRHGKSKGKGLQQAANVIAHQGRRKGLVLINRAERSSWKGCAVG